MSLLADLVCLACGRALEVASETEAVVRCGGCGQHYPRVGGIAVLLPNAGEHVELWRGQLRLLLDRGQQTLDGLTEAASAEGLSAATSARLRGLGQAVRQQVADVAAVLEPALSGATAPAAALPRGVVEYIGYLYRDWGWPSAGYRENDVALASLLELLGGRKLGRTLVLGAGACGLAYELHLRAFATQTVAVDIDPYLLVMAERIVRGAEVPLTEASVKVMDEQQLSRRWLLSAGSGPLSADVFQFLFADGTRPPFAGGSFDSVVTPWFIDQVPRNLPAFVAEVSRLLRPGGLWLNHGPLIYPETIAFEQRYAQAELFELLAAQGLSLLGSSRSSERYLVSPVSGSGKIEAVLSFLAERREL